MEKFECDKSLVFKQFGPYCWANALLMALFYSDGMRKLLIPRINKWEQIDSPKKIIKDLVLNHHVNVSEKHIKLFENFKPENLLKELYISDRELFNFDPDKSPGYSAGRYLTKLLKYLDITDFCILDALKTKNGYNNIYYGQHNVIKEHKNPLIKQFDKASSESTTKKYLLRIPEVLIIMSKKDSDIKFYPKYYYKQSLRFNPEIDYNNNKYVADSLLLTNFNMQTCKKGHEICGVTCNHKRYMYNGWTSKTIDTGIKGELKQKIPCSLMAHDWLDYTKSNFCINNKECGLYYHNNKKLLNEQLCFSYINGPRVYIYIRKDLLEDKSLEKPLEENKPDKPVKKLVVKLKKPLEKPLEEDKLDKPIKKLVVKLKKPLEKPLEEDKLDKPDKPVKKCPDDKILNPVSGVCVSKTGKIGKELLNNPDNPDKPDKPIKKCPEDKILNPISGVCVSKTGKIGKELLNKLANPDKLDKPVKKCPVDKILNPISGVCVSKTSKIGKELIKKGV
jgi:hypothetical protein